MEKLTPHCKLATVRTLTQNGKIRYTRAAMLGAALLGMTRADMVRIILALTMADFHKSMTTHADHRIWQDVYRPHTRSGQVYLKLTVVDDVLVVSFKEL